MTEESVNSLDGMRLRDDVVLVEPFIEKEVGGLIIPDSLGENGQIGIVKLVGPGFVIDGVCEEPMQVSVGDKIFYCKFAGSEILVDGIKYIIMRQEDILAKFNGERKIDLIPLESRMLIEWERGEDAFKGTTILRPEGASKERYYTGIVMSIGPKVFDVKIGERVFFDQFCGPERIDFENKRYALIWEKDAYCTIPLRKNILVLSH